MKRPLSLWLICDGKPGHENQSLGLAEALGRITPCEPHRITLDPRQGFVARLKSAFTQAAMLPPPDLIIGAGHRTHIALLALGCKYPALRVVLMRPSLPLTCFDLCLAPEHDFATAPHRDDLVLTRGALNRVVPAADRGEGHLILIGGPSRTHGWDGETLMDALKRITSRGPRWVLTDSRRTPAGFIDRVRNELPHIEVHAHTDTTPAWLPAQLAAARQVWVGEDSVSMIYESLSSGAGVGLLPMPRLRRDSRVLRGIDRLLQEGRLMDLEAWSPEAPMPQSGPLQEAARCARIVLDRLHTA